SSGLIQFESLKKFNRISLPSCLLSAQPKRK
ncbi:hypothetical protein Mgra_00006672, partial [Meloidogyne graminicola]